MAFKKAIEQDSGYDATYWRIDRLGIDWRSKSASIRLSGYKNEAERKQNSREAVMEQKNYRIKGKEFKKYFDVPSLNDFPKWESTASYSKKSVVSYNSSLYQAKASISSGGKNPKVSEDWEMYGDLRANRKIAYEYIKNNDIDFTDAKDA